MIIVIDTETTHYKPHLARVIEVGAVSYIRTQAGFARIESFESLSNPGIDLNGCERALAVSGITKAQVLAAPAEAEVAGRFRRWIETQQDVGKVQGDGELHLAGFNCHQYDAEILVRDPWLIPPSRWTWDVMTRVMPEMGAAGALRWLDWKDDWKWPRLDEAITFYGIQRKGVAHRALSDAMATMDILLKVLQLDTREVV